MEEKERYRLFGKLCIKDKRIKELEKENEQLKQQLEESEKKYEDRKQFCISEIRSRTAIINNLLEENEELQQQLAEKEDCNNMLCKCLTEKDIEIETQKEEINELKQQLYDLPKKIVEYFYDEIRHRAILEDDYCPDHNLERKYGVRKCLLENIRTTILKKYGGEDE